MGMLKKFDERLDYTLLFILLLFFIVSIFSLNKAHELGLTDRNYAYQQSIFYGLSLIPFTVILFINKEVFKKTAPFIYLLALLLLAGILIPSKITPVINGAKGWYQIGGAENGVGGVSIQPAELMKIGLIMGLAWVLHKHRYRKSIFNEIYLLIKLTILFAPVAYIIIQFPDLGSLISLFAIFLSMIFVSKIRLFTMMTFVFSLPAAGIGTLMYLYFKDEHYFFNEIVMKLPDYMQKRFYGWLKPDEYYSEAGFQLQQSLISIGSGKLTGMPITDYIPPVPYVYSESIFIVIGFSTGFIGSVFVILLYFLLLYRIVTNCIEIQDPFGKYVGTGVAGLITYQVFQNIGMSIGLLPITGLGLPFISYGGSSLIAFMICIALILNFKIYEEKYMFSGEKEVEG